MLEDQLFLVIGFKDDGILIESLDLSHKPDSTKQEYGDENLIATHCVEVHVLNALNGQFVLHAMSP
jgi:hypothetical protein